MGTLIPASDVPEWTLSDAPRPPYRLSHSQGMYDVQGVGESDVIHDPQQLSEPGHRPRTRGGWPDDTGLLAVTTNGLRFVGTEKGFQIRFDGIGTFRPYGNGAGVEQKTRRRKLQGFVTGDGWFIYNLMASLAGNLGRLIPPLDVARNYGSVFQKGSS